MISPSDTAYPLLKAHPSVRELEESFTPTLFELTFAEQRAREPIPTVGLLVNLKTFQRLGYFVKIAEVPTAIIRCIAKAAGYLDIPEGFSKYDDRPVRFRHMELVRSWVGVSAYGREARQAMLKACVAISRVREDLADIINFAIEELVRQRYELPGFSTLFRGARAARATVNRGYYARIADSLDSAAKERINRLFERAGDGRRTGWDLVKSEPRQPTVKEIKHFVAHLNWLRNKELWHLLNKVSAVQGDVLLATLQQVVGAWTKRRSDGEQSVLARPVGAVGQRHVTQCRDELCGAVGGLSPCCLERLIGSVLDLAHLPN
jgi:Domain of unknown function (DUF4158)